ncbi:glucose-1-phosphate adenylyltransferase, partial [Azospirillum brasilense]
SIVDGASLDNAMLRRSVVVERDARLEHCIVMERSRIGRGAQVRRAIIDQDNDIPAHERIGFDLEADRKRFHVTASGIVVVPRQFFKPQSLQSTTPSIGRARPSVASASEGSGLKVAA